MLIRDAVVGDGPALARVHFDAWHVGYAGLMPQGLLDATTMERRTVSWQLTLSGERTLRENILVAEVNGTPLGFAHTGPGRDADADGAGELWALNVAPSQWGSGLASTLVRTAHDVLRRGGFDRATLWVLTGNARARRFYERHGWSPDGVAREETIRGFTIPELRYTLDLRLT
ncbi:N-acetyltransferase [Kitasatospora acidiphila]|uniref:N-acetyltransferase n=1 Tax=Kitasatospora acidiphila TaxID=2567942 RepID=A0A540W0Q2_9ACTN|nr:GNAT family N-acetyltransferase [Kitasatospora acidiphila]TQF01934.1 N-acetyltransferase [Kitasatospora acidiphila]